MSSLDRVRVLFIDHLKSTLMGSTRWKLRIREIYSTIILQWWKFLRSSNLNKHGGTLRTGCTARRIPQHFRGCGYTALVPLWGCADCLPESLCRVAAFVALSRSFAPTSPGWALFIHWRGTLPGIYCPLIGILFSSTASTSQEGPLSSRKAWPTGWRWSCPWTHNYWQSIASIPSW